MKNNKSQKNIPTGWKQVTLGDLFDFKNGLNSEKENFGYGMRFINIMEILNHDFLVAKNIPGRINVNSKRSKENIVEYGDVLFNRTSETPDEVGMTSVYLDNEPVVFGGFVIRAKPKTKDLNDLFKKYCFSSEAFRKEVIKQGQGVVRGNIGQNNLRVIPFLLPPKEEQARIVSILEAWNQVIEKLSKRIEIKKQIKTGLMQDLLTGKKRLKGFSDKWESFELGDISKMSSGGTPKSTNESYYGGSIPWVSIADMTANGKFIYSTLKNLTKEGLENSSARVYPKGTILYAMYASIGECSIAGVEMSSSQAILGIIPEKERLNPMFLYYYLISIKERIKLEGQQGTQSNLNAGMVREFVLDLPPINEQEKIIEILTTADDEIIALENKLKILKEQKRYLLNNLITGTIRTPETLSIYQ